MSDIAIVAAGLGYRKAVNDILRHIQRNGFDKEAIVVLLRDMNENSDNAGREVVLEVMGK